MGSPPCSPQMPSLIPGRAARPRSFAIRTSAPTPATSIDWNGSFAKMPASTYAPRNLPASSREMPSVVCVRSLVPKLKNSAV